MALERFDPSSNDIREETQRHHIIRYQFASDLAGNKCLDLCCGCGYGSNILKTENPNGSVLGVDIDPLVISNNKQKYPNCKFEVVDVENLYLNEQFDLIVMFEAIGYLTYRSGLYLIKKIKYKLLADDGIFILSTPRDTQTKVNHFHKSIWTFPILKNELGSIFSKIIIYGQDRDTGIISEENVIDNDFYIAVCN